MLFIIIHGTFPRMPVMKLSKQTMRKRIHDAILNQVTSGKLPVGSRLPPIKALAKQFEVSFRTIQMALAELAEEGFLELRHGAGTYVTDARAALTLNDTVAIFMNANEHLFSDLTRSLTSRLHDLGRMPTTVDTAHSEASDMIRRLARAGTSTFIATDFPAHHFPVTDPIFTDKFIIAALHWDNESTRSKTAAVLSDHRLGGELVARHLYAAGHRRIILTGPETMLDDPRRHAAGFTAEWQSLGGRLDRIRLHFTDTNPPTIDNIITPDLFHSPNAPTAAFGTRDFDVYSLHQALALQNIDLAARCELIGYGNTPWSEIGMNGFSSVDWCIDLIAEKVCHLIQKADQTGDRSIGSCDWVSPKLVLRRHSQD